MKQKSNPFLRSVLLTSAAVAFSISAQAGTYYWDTNGSGTAGFGAASGTWDTDAFWGTDAAGSGATANTTITIADSINFGTASAGLATGSITGPSTAQGFLNMTFGSLSDAIVLSGGTLNLASTSTITVNNTSDTISTVLQGSGQLTKTGSGMLTLSGANTYSGATAISAGILNVASLSDYGVNGSLGNRLASAETATGEGIGIHLGLGTAGATLQYTGSTAQSTNRQIRLSAANNTIDASGTGAGTLSFTYSGTNTNLFDTAGTRTLTLTGSNTGNNTFAIRVENQGPNATSLTKNGAGTWVLTGASTYTGATTISGGGILSVSSLPTTGDTSSNLGLTSTINIGGGSSSGTLLYTGAAKTTDRIIAMAGGTQGSNVILDQSGTGLLKFTGNFTNGSALITKNLTLQGSTAGTGEISGSIPEGGSSMVTSLTKAGTGTWTLSGANYFTGKTQVDAGTLILGTSGGNPQYGALENSSLLTINNTGTKVQAMGANAFKGWSGGNMAVTINGGELTLNNGATTGGNHNLGNVILNGGTISGLGDATYGGFNLNGTLTVTDNSTISATNTNTNGGNRTVTVSAGKTLNWSGSISNTNGAASSLTFDGPGTTVLSGANSYTGTTTVSNGKLIIDGNISTSSTTVSGSGTLGGGGTLGAVIVQSGGTLAPGNSPGNIAMASLSLADNANFDIEINKALTPTNDSVTLTGNFSNVLAITTGANLNLTLTGTFVLGDRFTLADYNTINGSWNSGLFNLGAGTSTLADDSVFQSGGYNWRINYDDLTNTATNSTESYTDGGKYLTLTVIPEPNVAALLGGLGTLLLLRRRRA